MEIVKHSVSTKEPFLSNEGKMNLKDYLDLKAFFKLEIKTKSMSFINEPMTN